MSMKYSKKWTIIITSGIVILFVLIMEGVSWKERADFYRTVIGEHTHILDLNELARETHYEIGTPPATRLPNAQSEEEVAHIIQRFQENNDSMTISDHFKDSSYYENVYTEGAFQPLNETLAVKGQLLFDHWRHQSSVSIDEAVEQWLEEELTLTLRGIWSFEDRYFLHAHLESINDLNHLLDTDVRPTDISFDHFFRFQYADDETFFSFPLTMTRAQVLEDGSWELRFTIDQMLQPPSFIHYVTFDDDYFNDYIKRFGNRTKIEFIIDPNNPQSFYGIENDSDEVDKDNDMVKTKPIQFHPYAPIGKEYRVDKSINLTPAHEIIIHRIISFAGYSIWDIELLSTNANDQLVEFRSTIRPMNGSTVHHNNYSHGFILPNKDQDNSYFIMTNPLPSFDDASDVNYELVIENAVISKGEAYAIQLEDIKPPHNVVRYRGWDLSVTGLFYNEDNQEQSVPKQLDILIDYESPYDGDQQQMQQDASMEYTLIDQIFIVGTDSETNDKVFKIDSLMQQWSPFRSIEPANYSVQLYHHGFWSDSVDLQHEIQFSGTFDDSRFDYKLIIPPFMTSITEIETMIKLEDTGLYYLLD